MIAELSLICLLLDSGIGYFIPFVKLWQILKNRNCPLVDVQRRTNYIPSSPIELWFYLLQIQFVLLHTEKKNKCTCRHTMFVEPSHSPSIHSINFSQNAQQTLFEDRLFAPPLCLSVQSSAVLRSRIKAHHFWGFMFYVPIVQNTMQTGVCRCSGLSKIKHYLLLSK